MAIFEVLCVFVHKISPREHQREHPNVHQNVPYENCPLQGAQLTNTSPALRKMIPKGWYPAMCAELDVILSHIHTTPGELETQFYFYG